MLPVHICRRVLADRDAAERKRSKFVSTGKRKRLNTWSSCRASAAFSSPPRWTEHRLRDDARTITYHPLSPVVRASTRIHVLLFTASYGYTGRGRRGCKVGGVEASAWHKRQGEGREREPLVHFNALSRIGLRLKEGIGAFAYGADCSNISGSNADGSSIPGGG